jgi:hypothetical protein
MPQHDYGNPTSPFTGTQLNSRLRSCFDALHSLHRGTSRPNYAVAGMLWLREISLTEWRLHLYDGDTDILLGTINPTANTFTPAGVTGFAPLTGATFTGAVVVPNATADWHALNRITADARYAQLTGATFTGNVFLSKTDPALILNKTASGQISRVIGSINGVYRWGIELGAWQSETGSNAGSNFVLARYSDSGTFLGTPMVIDRATGAVTLEAPLTLPASNPTDANHAARKAYVDSEIASAVGSVPVVWEKIADIAIAGSTVVEVTGFSLVDYRAIVAYLIGARLSTNNNDIYTQVYRGGSLVSTGYSSVREIVTNSGVSSGSGASAYVPITENITANEPLTSMIMITQASSGEKPQLQSQSVYTSSAGATVHRSAGSLSSGSGWVTGVRVVSPSVSFQASIGRFVLMGIKA